MGMKRDNQRNWLITLYCDKCDKPGLPCFCDEEDTDPIGELHWHNPDEHDHEDEPDACPECGNAACFGHGYGNNDY